MNVPVPDGIMLVVVLLVIFALSVVVMELTK